MIFYIIVDNNDYMNDEFEPFAEFYNTRKEALEAYFDGREIYDLRDFEYYDEDDKQHYQMLNDMSDDEYYNYLLKHHEYGDGESVKIIYEVNTDTKQVIWMDE